jgi:hypothetical protein
VPQPNTICEHKKNTRWAQCPRNPTAQEHHKRPGTDWNHLNVHGHARAAEIVWPAVAALLKLG